MLSIDWKEAGKRLKQALGLSHAPIAITFSQEAPAGASYSMTERCLSRAKMDAQEK